MESKTGTFSRNIPANPKCETFDYLEPHEIMKVWELTGWEEFAGKGNKIYVDPKCETFDYLEIFTPGATTNRSKMQLACVIWSMDIIEIYNFQCVDFPTVSNLIEQLAQLSLMLPMMVNESEGPLDILSNAATYQLRLRRQMAGAMQRHSC